MPRRVRYAAGLTAGPRGWTTRSRPAGKSPGENRAGFPASQVADDGFTVRQISITDAVTAVVTVIVTDIVTVLRRDAVW